MSEVNLYKAIWELEEYVPSWAQQPFHDSECRIKLGIGGVRSGKSTGVAREADKHVFTPDGLIWIIGPDYDQAQAEFNYLYAPLKALGFIVKESLPSTGSRSFITEWGLKCETLSTQRDTDHIASFAPTLILLVEAGQQPYAAFEKSVERALEKRAPILISGTLEKNKYPWYAQKAREWAGVNSEGAASFSLPSWSNEKIFPGGRQDPAILEMEQILSPAKFLERCAAVPMKPEGLVFPEFNYSTHVSDKIKVHPDVPIGLAIDPGYAGGYAVLFVQKIGVLYNVLSEVYIRRTRVRDVIAVVKEHPLIEHVTHAVIDIAGNQHQADESQVEIWTAKENFPDIDFFYNRVGILDGIELLAARLKVDDILGRPLVQFSPDFSSEVDHDGASLGTFAELETYSWSERSPKVGEAKKPIDANNHGLKALIYYIFNYDGHYVLDVPQRATVRKRSYWH